MGSDVRPRHKSLKVRSSERDGTRFVAMPDCVLCSPAYMALSHPARSLLMDIALQCVRDNNGQLLASMAHLQKRGWTSADTITRAKRELLEAGFIFETVKGHRPNKASWYAVTWRRLDRHPDYDHGAVESFDRSAYLKTTGKGSRSAPAGGVDKNARLKPPAGVGGPTIAPTDGIGSPRSTPPGGAIGALSVGPSTPPDGNHLEVPSAAALVPAHEPTSQLEEVLL